MRPVKKQLRNIIKLYDTHVQYDLFCHVAGELWSHIDGRIYIFIDGMKEKIK